MPVSSEVSIAGPYYPNGVTVDFAFEFKAASAGEVVATDGDGNAISATLYSVTLDDDEGGTLSFGSAPAAADYPVLYVVSDPALTQPADFDNAGPSFNPAALTRAIDRAAVRDLKQQRDIDRGLKVPFGETPPLVDSLTGADGKVLGIVNGKIAPIANDVAGAEDAAARATAAADAVGVDRLAVAADKVGVAADRLAVAADRAAADQAAADTSAARDQAIAAGTAQDIYPIAARDDVPRGATGTGAITGGSTGTDGTFALAFTGGNFDVNPMGNFTVSGGAVTAITITGAGLYIGAAPTAPTLDFSASTGLTSAAATLTVDFLVPAGRFYYTPSTDDGFVSQFQNVAGVATLVEEHFDPLSVGAAAAYADAAAASAASLIGINMWPDPEFHLSAGYFGYMAGDYRLYSRAANFQNATWDADYKHPYGLGAWEYNSALSTLMGFETHFAGPGTNEFGIVPGDVISVGVEVVASAGRVSLSGRFYSAVTSNNYTLLGTQINGSAGILMDGAPKVLLLENLTVPADAIGLLDYCFDTTASDFRVLRRWVVKGATAGSTLPLRGTAWEQSEVAAAAADALLGAPVEWAVAPALVYDSRDAVIPASATGDGTSNALIKGWASVLSPAGVSFNAITVRNVKQPVGLTDLDSVGIVVRKGATGTVQNSGATIVAVGTAKVTDDNRARLDIALRDPSSNAFITLDDSDLDTDEYAVMVYGLTAAGATTSIVLPLGTLSNQVGRTYHITTADPKTGAWIDTTGDPGVGLEHSFLDNLREGFGPTTLFAQQVIDTASAASAASVFASHGQRLRRFRAFTAKRLLGQSARFALALIGDSWSTFADFYSRDLANLLIAKYGDGGVGWFGCGFTGAGASTVAGDARGLYTMSRTGTWTSNYHAGSTSPNISDARSSEAAAKLTISNVEGATHPALSAVKLHFKGTADGVIRWRWNGGAWSADTNVQGTLDAQQTLDLAGFPTGALAGASAAAITLEIEVVSGSVVLSGADFQSSSDGIVLHKLGSSGSKASDWLTSNAAQWQAAIALLDPDGAQFLFGTNEDSAGQSAETIRDHYETLAGRVRTAAPSCDLLLAVAPDNLLDNATDMTGYAAAIYELVDGASPQVFAAFCDLQPAYGDPANKAEYASTGTLPLFKDDDTHPNETGAAINAREFALTWESR